MELIYDWCNFHATFSASDPTSRANQARLAKLTPVYVVVEGTQIMSAQSGLKGDSLDLSGWAGAEVEQLRGYLKSLPEPRTLEQVSCAQAEEWMQKSLEYSNFFEQSRFIRKQAELDPDDFHFLFAAILGMVVKDFAFGLRTFYSAAK